jgi:membrane fusion protein, multidrug efflux system
MSVESPVVLDENATLTGAVPVRKRGLRRLRWPLMSLAAIAVLGGGAYFYATSGRYQSTDDAYAQAATVSISANVGGRVSGIEVRDNEIVQRGATLFELDGAPFRIAVSDAAAHLADTRLQIESLQAAHALDAARQQVANVQQRIGVALANLRGDANIAPERHPLVAQAQAALDRAQLNLSHTVINAPTGSVVAKVEQLQVGDTIAASAPVFALVSTRDVWIEANFKEVQLAQMLTGQTATVETDRYPGRRFSAKVTSVSPSTGSQFSLLPPENATGNWVKVVQRVPVRLQLTDVDAEFLLHARLSANVTVDTHAGDPTLTAETGPTSAGAVPR